MNRAESERALVELLRLAYSGELAAALAYRGHRQSVRAPEERAAIRKIELEEYVHRQNNLDMLEALGKAPSARREVVMGALGSTLGRLCGVTGWLLPMYGAAVLETKNVKEYDDAARYARGCGRDDFIARLEQMADVELEHELYFKERVRSHPLGRRLPLPPCTRGEVVRDLRAARVAESPMAEDASSAVDVDVVEDEMLGR